MCLLAETELQLLCLEQAERHAQTALSLRPDHRITCGILAKTLALSDDPGNWKKAVNMAKELLAEGQCELAAEALCQAYLQLRQWTDLLTALPCLSHAPALAALLHLECDHQGAGKELLPTLAQHTPDCPEAWYRIGQLYNTECSYDLACTAFLKCAKLAPHWYTAYLQLGHIYARSNATLDKAHSPTQMALSDTYRALGDGKSNLSLLEDISQRPEGRWACARLGLQYWDLGDTSAAINCLRAALKSDPDNSHMWEALADAYMARGANGSAFEIIPESPASPLALKGLCETCLYLAREHLTTPAHGPWHVTVYRRASLPSPDNAECSSLRLVRDIECFQTLTGWVSVYMWIGGLDPYLGRWHYLTVPEVLRSKSASEATQQGLQLLQLGATLLVPVSQADVRRGTSCCVARPCPQLQTTGGTILTLGTAYVNVHWLLPRRVSLWIQAVGNTGTSSELLLLYQVNCTME
ncbi:uncharacterized protein LOC124373556 [Homalodisca vitripennis]|uniref:uncharacterized protein LOC124373556 n=1 Tax=Homalodisca vitripennis TaxID=197043 RepID=UPI001EEB3087|nr:uncharacterized protein LOC124373556 [Homalodisca vitripennis]